MVIVLFLSRPLLISDDIESKIISYFIGIRIEDVLHVVDLQNSSHYFDRLGAYKFDDITMVPIQTKLIDIDLLTDSEVNLLFLVPLKAFQQDQSIWFEWIIVNHIFRSNG